jgi:hypothetical protein
LKYFFIGLGLSIIGIIISFILWNFEKAYLITGGIGFLFISLSMLFSGVLVSGDRLRANYATESTDDRRERTNTAVRLGLIGLPNMIIAVLLFYLMK